MLRVQVPPQKIPSPLSRPLRREFFDRALLSALTDLTCRSGKQVLQVERLCIHVQ